MPKEARYTSAEELSPGTVAGVEGWALGATREGTFAVSRRCRHLGGDLGKGTIAGDGCLVCPRHAAKYDTSSGHMVRGPQGVFAKIPGLGMAFKTLTRVLPLKRGKVSRQGKSYVIKP